MIYFIEWEFLSFNSCAIIITFLFDWISLLFLRFVIFISSLVIFYRINYIKSDLFINRFIILVLLFVFSIAILIIRPNLIRILLGWDGLGLVSYCLVIYFQNIKSFNAGMLTALTNRVGDVFLLIRIAWIINYGRWSFIFYIEIIKNDYSIKIIAVLILIAAITKRAQIPFSSWLPAAIAAPTPVSALVHSSTLVTAGVYLLIRFNILILNSLLGSILLFIGGLTILIAGICANFEFDLKKIIALSTLRQLGLIIRILSLGFSKLVFFHLLTHALFKALLFLCAGTIIHSLNNSQDIRDIGSLINTLPFSVSCFNISNLALCGFPFLAGFYSKDLILELSLYSNFNLISFFFFFFSTGLTVRYSFRLTYYSFFIRLNFKSLNNMIDENWIISKRLFFLSLIAIIGGSVLNWILFDSNILIYLPFFLKVFTLIICFIGGMIGYFLSFSSFFSINKSFRFYSFFIFQNSIWFFPFISTISVIYWPLVVGQGLIKNFDQGWSEFFGGQNLNKFLKNFSIINQFFFLNNLKIYLIFFVFWVIFLVFFLFIYSISL